MILEPGFNVRVYGLARSKDRNRILVVEELIQGQRIRKFPGGGVESGEGPGNALIREFIEELQISIRLGSLFYASPQFHRSYFRAQQLIALYWEVELDEKALKPHLEGYNVCWVPIHELEMFQMTHPLDQEVAREIVARCRA